VVKISTFLNIKSELELMKRWTTHFEVFEVVFCVFFHTINLLNLWKRVWETGHTCFSVYSRYLTGIAMSDSIFPYH